MAFLSSKDIMGKVETYNKKCTADNPKIDLLVSTVTSTVGLC